MKRKKGLPEQDLKNWENYIKNPKDIFDKEKKNIKNISKSRYRFDLHGFNLTQANEKAKEIILKCSEDGYKDILLITGKGLHSNTQQDAYKSESLGKLRYSVPDYIKNNDELIKLISDITLAEDNEGGSGAIIIKLKKL